MNFSYLKFNFKSLFIYVRDLWYLAPNTIGPVAKKQPLSTLSSTDGAW